MVTVGNRSVSRHALAVAAVLVLVHHVHTAVTLARLRLHGMGASVWL